MTRIEATYILSAVLWAPLFLCVKGGVCNKLGSFPTFFLMCMNSKGFSPPNFLILPVFKGINGPRSAKINKNVVHSNPIELSWIMAPGTGCVLWERP
jgi:hypothetical protein